MRPSPRDTIEDLRRQRFAEAQCLFLAGSVLRQEGTPTSDLDVVVIYSQIPAAFRESLHHWGWPVELFVHDPETLACFLARDRVCGVPSLAAMLAEGLELPESTRLSRRLKSEARAYLRHGPPAWSSDQIDEARYQISDICDDLRYPRSRAETVASACRLYPLLGEFCLRVSGKWSATGKSLVGCLRQFDGQLAVAFEQAFDRLFSEQDTAPVVQLVESVLQPWGGPMFDSPPRPAPAAWRLRPSPRLFTQRLVLRMGEESDIPALLEYFSRNQARLAPLEPERPADFLTPAYWRGYLALAREEFAQEKALRLLLFARGSRQVAGVIHFTQMFRGPFQACYLGFSLDQGLEGQGLMCEALKKAIEYVFSSLNFHRIMANHLPENERSARLLQRLGFRTEGRAEQYLRIGGTWRDHVLCALTRPPGG